jgi:hypothetical protein
MPLFRHWLRRYQDRPHVRPWALSVPVVVLLIALPLLRPLRHPDPDSVSDDERARLATVQALVERRTLAIDDTAFLDTAAKVQRNGHWYSNQPPTLSVLLAGTYWVLHRLGHTFATNPNWVAYLLTLVGTTLPVAFAGGLVYRMGRLFELPRPWRTGLALAVVLGSGLISYATVLNAHAPAAALVLASAASLIHVTITNRRLHGSVWLAVSGACAALAAALEPAAVLFIVLFGAVVVSLRWTVVQRVAGLMVYLAAAAAPVLLHVALVQRTTGNVWQGCGLGRERLVTDAPPPTTLPDRRGLGVSVAFPEYEEEEPESTSAWQPLWSGLGKVLAAFFGRHGVLSHFPIAVLGLVGVAMVMHRHWPPATKVLASATLAGAVVIILLYALRSIDWTQAMFATRWFIVFLPMTVFWGGVWLRRRHRTVSWVLAGVLLGFSVVVSLLGATGPLPREGFSIYTAAGAAQNLVRGSQGAPEMPPVATDFRPTRSGEEPVPRKRGG